MSYDVAIVGSGFSAIALTINLLKRLPASSTIAVVSDDPGFGRGTAYRTEFYLHRLNVPAARMSVFPDAPDDFVEWLAAHGTPVTADEFATRGDYGLYLRDRLAALLRSRRERAQVDFVKAKATACLQCETDGIVFRLDNGTDLQARNVVLCLGVGNAELPVRRERIATEVLPRIVQNPWRLGWLSRVGRGDEICIFGSGLTMVDQVISLRARGHRGRIHVLSRRGLVPHGHLLRRSSPVELQLPESRALSEILKNFRRQVREGANWRGVMDGLRPRTQQLWRELSREQRSRFLRHALPWWNIHRHRIAPEIFSRFDSLRRDGTVTIHAGFVRSIEASGKGAEVLCRCRGSDRSEALYADWIVNCTGMERAGIRHSPLLGAMLAGGFISMDELGLGIEVDEASQVLAPGGRRQTGLFAVGALTAGQFWEITAVPDIRLQAQRVSETIAAGPVFSREPPVRAT